VLDTARLDSLGPSIAVDGVRSIAMAPDGKSFVAVDGTGTVILRSLPDGAEVRKFAGLDRGARLSFAPDGKTLLGSDFYGTTIQWNVKTGAAARKLAGGTSAYGVGFSPDGAIAYVAGWDSSLRLWNLKTGKALPALWADTPVDLVRFGKANATATTVLPTGVTMQWSLKDGALLATAAHFDGGATVTLTPEGFFDGNDDGAANLRLVRGRDVFALGDAAGVLHRPDLVAAKLVNAGDPNVKKAAAKLDLGASLGDAQPIATEAQAAATAPTKATHVVVSKTTLRAEPDDAAEAGVDLMPGTQVAVVEAKGAWSLVARDGRPIGYVASEALAPLQ
jgi:hypothetical protein